MPKKIIIPLFILIALVVFWGIRDTNLNLKIRFDQAYGLKKEGRILFEQNQVGSVKSINYGNNGVYTIDIEIRKNFTNAATEHSRFFVIDDPQSSGTKAVEIVLMKAGGTTLKDGKIVEGSNRGTALFEKLETDIEKGVEYLRREFSRFQTEWEKVPESREYKDLKRELSELASEMSKASEETRKKIQKEIIPLLKQELEKLKEKLKKIGKEQQTKPLEIELERIEKT